MALPRKDETPGGNCKREVVNLGRGKRSRPFPMKVVLEPVDAPLAEYEQAWMEALGVIHRLAREKRAASPKPDGPTRT